jgi:hypothetical protein
MTNELKPCPFCGGKPEIMGEIGLTMTLNLVLCRKCHSVVSFSRDGEDGDPKGLSRAKTIETYNRRVENETNTN